MVCDGAVDKENTTITTGVFVYLHTNKYVFVKYVYVERDYILYWIFLCCIGEVVIYFGCMLTLKMKMLLFNIGVVTLCQACVTFLFFLLFYFLCFNPQ